MKYRRQLPQTLGFLIGIAQLAAAAEPIDLSGTWDEVTPRKEYQSTWLESAPWVLTFDGRVVSWQEGGGVIRQSLFIQDDAHAAIDFMTVVDGAFLTTKALFEVDGDTLTIREGAINEPRPSTIIPKEGAADAWLPVRIYMRRPNNSAGSKTVKAVAETSKE
jgi:hypothetical protein